MWRLLSAIRSGKAPRPKKKRSRSLVFESMETRNLFSAGTVSELAGLLATSAVYGPFTPPLPSQNAVNPCPSQQSTTQAAASTAGASISVPFSTYKFSMEKFYEYCESAFPQADYARMKAGLQTFMNYLVKDKNITNVDWAAYMLATVKMETGSFRPIEERYALWKNHTGKGQYAELLKAPDGKTSQRYYGRGYVQLTWKANYIKLGKALGVGNILANKPALALDSKTAYNILSVGMRKGLFTGKKLSDFFPGGGKKNDWYGARKIINPKETIVDGRNRSYLVAMDGVTFCTALVYALDP